MCIHISLVSSNTKIQYCVVTTNMATWHYFNLGLGNFLPELTKRERNPKLFSEWLRTYGLAFSGNFKGVLTLFLAMPRALVRPKKGFSIT